MRHVSMGDVARTAGVSKNTVSLSLRGSSRVSESTRRHVEEIAAAMGYRRNPTVAQLMAELRQSRSPGFQATLAVLNAHEDADAFRCHPTIPAYLRGCRERAGQLGYQLDEFWLHEPRMSAKRWLSIFRSRNIRGILVIGLMRQNRLPVALAPLWAEYPAVVTGVRTREPALSFACSDHHALAMDAYAQAVGMGCRRPALVLDAVIDELTEGRFTAGFLTAQSRMAREDLATRPFYDVAAARRDRGIFREWLEANNPDVIFSLYHEVRGWLAELGKRVPRDIQLIQYEWRDDHSDWAGMDQRNDLVGAAALEMVVAMIQHGEHGIPENPKATMIGAVWRSGATAAAARPRLRQGVQSGSAVSVPHPTSITKPRVNQASERFV